MTSIKPEKNAWASCRIGITGATGTLGRSLTKKLRARGAEVIGLTHGKIPTKKESSEEPQKWIQWSCGRETDLNRVFINLDILIINHGINPQGSQSNLDINKALEINSLSSWKLMQAFESISLNSTSTKSKEIWINTSEAEIQPALSPAYEISKRLLGHLVSIRWNNQNSLERKKLRIRKLVLGPFRSKLNPIGLLSSDIVAEQIIKQAEIGLNLIIVTPNPLTYLIMPLTEVVRMIYSKMMKFMNKNEG